MKKRIFSLLLAICCVLAMLPAAAPKVSAADLPAQSVSTPTTVNPLYEDILEVEDFIDQLKDLKRPAHSGGMTTMSSEDEYVDLYAAMVEVRESLKARESSFTVYYYVPFAAGITDEQAYVVESALAILAAAMSHTGDPTEGDYLLWQWGTYDFDGLYGVDEEYGLYYVEMTYHLTYFTTAEQEAEMDAAVDSLLADLDLDEATEYAKIKRVYDYICANVTYDYDNLYDDSYLLKYTGYAALVDGTAVCQGYAVLFYRLMLELGIDARVIVGWQTSTGGAHAWNIVDLYDSYYNLDATWDAGVTDYNFFLTNEVNFVDHTRDPSYNTADFHSEYPMSETDFEPFHSGVFASGAEWKYDAEDGILRIDGEGATDSYELNDDTDAPWVPWKEGISQVVVGEGITEIGDNAFANCTNLEYVSLPDSVEVIGVGAFFLCDGLKSLTLPAQLKHIGNAAFYYCGLQTIDFPNGLETIGTVAFANCELERVVMPDSVTEIGSWAFGECAQLVEIRFSDNLTVLPEFVCIYNSNLTKVTLPAKLKTIGHDAFANCESLGNIELPESLETIGYNAFAYGALQSIQIPANVKSIESWAFDGQRNLRNIFFVGDAPEMGTEPFRGVEATAYYPAGNKTWTEGILRQYGGTITWEPFADRDGWVKTGDTWYYFQDGKAHRGWLKSGGYWYYMGADGAMQTGWVDVNGSRYYMNQNGVMLTGWVKVDGNWYYMASGGAMQTGWLTLSGKTYYLHDDGVMATGLTEIDGTYYYFAVGGTQQTGWQTIDGVRHLFSRDGKAATGWYKTGGKWYYLKDTGAVTTGWAKVSGKWYYLDAEGVMQTGWIQVDGYRYYMGSSGVMMTGWVSDGGKWYYMSSGGVLQTGWVSVNGHWYYMNSDGVMQTGWVSAGSKWYYMASSGAMHTGWLKDGNYWYYLGSDGAMVTGTQVIDGKTYIFNKSGVWIG